MVNIPNKLIVLMIIMFSIGTMGILECPRDNGGDASPSPSINPICGNGTIEGDEQCDDGNTVNGDRCSSTCLNESDTGRCGDGTLNPGSGEECDDGNTENYDWCASNCEFEVDPLPYEATIVDGAPFTNKKIKYYIDPSGFSEGDGIGLKIEYINVNELSFTVNGLELFENGGEIEIWESPAGLEDDDSLFDTDWTVASTVFTSSETNISITHTLDKTLCHFPTERFYTAVVYPTDDDFSSYLTGSVRVSLAKDKTDAIYSRTGAHVGDLLYRDGYLFNVFNIGHVAMYYGKDVDGNDLVIESNVLKDACGEDSRGVIISYARNSLDNNKWYGAFYPKYQTTNVDKLISDAECELGSDYQMSQSIRGVTSCGNEDGYFRCDMFTQYLYENQNPSIDISVDGEITSPYMQMFYSDLEKRLSSAGSMSIGDSGLESKICPDGSAYDSVWDPCNHDEDKDGFEDFLEQSLGTNPVGFRSRPADFDGDFIPDIIDTDDDNDGHPDVRDAFPFDASEWLDNDRDGIGDNADTDDDNDGVSDADEIEIGTDPKNPLSTPSDYDGDGILDFLDEDDDNDGVPDAVDLFPYNRDESRDNDRDSIGDNADLDDDDDLYPDAIELTLGTDPFNAESKPPDHDMDLIPDAIDSDDDNDGVPDVDDAFPFDAVESVDTDGDGIGDNVDTDDDNDCYSDAIEISLGTSQLDNSSYPPDCDLNCVPDIMEDDDDKDGYIDREDAFICDASEWFDTDGDGIGNNADLDDDNDCYSDIVEGAEGSSPVISTSTPVDCDNNCNPDSTDPDDDKDGYADFNDAFICDASEWLDTDGDGVGNNADLDDDDDGYSDEEEIAAGTDPLDPSSRPAIVYFTDNFDILDLIASPTAFSHVGQWRERFWHDSGVVPASSFAIDSGIVEFQVSMSNSALNEYKIYECLLTNSSFNSNVQRHITMRYRLVSSSPTIQSFTLGVVSLDDWWDILRHEIYTDDIPLDTGWVTHTWDISSSVADYNYDKLYLLIDDTNDVNATYTLYVDNIIVHE